MKHVTGLPAGNRRRRRSRRATLPLATSAATAGRTRVLVGALTLFVVMAVLVTGCTVQFGLDTEIEADGSGTVAIRLAADKELQDQLSQATDSIAGLGGLSDLEALEKLGDSEGLGMLGSILRSLDDTGILERLGTLGTILGIVGDVSNALPKDVDELFDTILGQIPGGWWVERGSDGSGARWINLTRPFADLDELRKIMSEGLILRIAPMEEFHISQHDGIFGAKTKFSTSLDPEKVMAEQSERASSLPADLLAKVLAVQYRLTLPGEIGDNNADRRDDNTLVWNVGFSGKSEMYAESGTVNWGAVSGVIVGGVLALALVILALILFLRRRRRKNRPAQPGDTMVPSPAMPAGKTVVGAAAAPEATVPDKVTVPDEATVPAGAAMPDAAMQPAAATQEPLSTAQAAPPADAPLPADALPARPTATPTDEVAAPVADTTVSNTPQPPPSIPLRPPSSMPDGPITDATGEDQPRR